MFIDPTEYLILTNLYIYALFSFLYKYPGEKSLQTSNGFTSLHILANGVSLECIRYLIERGADADAKDNAGLTALHISARRLMNLTITQFLAMFV